MILSLLKAEFFFDAIEQVRHLILHHRLFGARGRAGWAALAALLTCSLNTELV